MLEKAMKNKDKKQFDFNSNNCCFDFIIKSNNDPTVLFGSWVPGYGSETYDLPDEYNEKELLDKAIKKTKQFLNLNNKKVYDYGIVSSKQIDLWNNETEAYETFTCEINFTYCP